MLTLLQITQKGEKKEFVFNKTSIVLFIAACKVKHPKKRVQVLKYQLVIWYVGLIDLKPHSGNIQ